MRQGSSEGKAEGLGNQHFNYMKAIVFYLECKLMKLISLCSMNPLACQIIARGLDSASQFLAYCSGGEKQTGLYHSSRDYTLGFTSTSRPLLTFPLYLVAIYMRYSQYNASINRS